MNAVLAPVVGTGTSSTYIDDYAMQRIDFRVGRLARSFHLDEDHADDLRQDMVLELLKALPRFDSSRCSRRTFICRILNRAFKHMVRMLKSRLVHKAMRPIRLGDSEPVRNEPGKGELSEQDLIDVGLDLPEILPTMPPRLERIAKALMAGDSPADIARALKIHRCNVLRAMSEIRVILHNAGYGPEGIHGVTATNAPHTQK